MRPDQTPQFTKPVATALRIRPDQTPQVTTPVAAHAPVTVMIADFSNHTREAVFDNALTPVVQMAFEETGFISAYDRLL
jgi:hypothetical protein